MTLDKNDAPIDVQNSDGSEFFEAIESEPKGNDWVIAMWRGTPFSQKGKHKQRVNGFEAVFPLNKMVIVPYFYVHAARNSGNVDFVEDNRVGAKNMKMVKNTPDIIVHKVVPKEYNSKSKIMAYVGKIKREHGKAIELAVEQL